MRQQPAFKGYAVNQRLATKSPHMQGRGALWARLGENPSWCHRKGSLFLHYVADRPGLRHAHAAHAPKAGLLASSAMASAPACTLPLAGTGSGQLAAIGWAIGRLGVTSVAQ